MSYLCLKKVRRLQEMNKKLRTLSVVKTIGKVLFVVCLAAHVSKG